MTIEVIDGWCLPHEVDNDVQRLKLLKTSYDSQHYTLEDNFLIRFPKLIKAAEEKLACVKVDMETAEEALLKAPEFSIVIRKMTFTERADGGAVMLETVSKCKTGETTHLGTYKGFELLVEKNFIGVNNLILRGRTDYKAELSASPVGNMVKLENLFHGIGENAAFLTKKIEQYHRDMEESRLEYEKPFAHEGELQEKIARQNELNVLLDLENGKDQDADVYELDEAVSDSHVAERDDGYHTGNEDRGR